LTWIRNKFSASPAEAGVPYGTVAPGARDIIGSMPASSRAQVLAVDDDAEMRQFLLSALRDSFDVLLATSLDDALAAIDSPARLAAVVCDLNLGGGEEGLINMNLNKYTLLLRVLVK